MISRVAIAFGVLALSCSVALFAAEASGGHPSSTISPESIADAIYWAEGGPSTRHPYGILSVPVRGAGPFERANNARVVCLRTIQNNVARWKSAGSPGDFLDFLADRYCPVSADPDGNRNWKKNVRWLLSHPDKCKTPPHLNPAS